MRTHPEVVPAPREQVVNLEEAMAAYERGELSGGDMMTALRIAHVDENVVQFFGRLHDHSVDQARKLKGKA